MNWPQAISTLSATGQPAAAAAEPMDSAQFAAFYERSARPLWLYLARVSGDPALADDLAQESFVRLLCATQPRDGEVACRRYLFAIATNLLRDHWRRPRHTSIDELPEDLFAWPRQLCPERLSRRARPRTRPDEATRAATPLARPRRELHTPRDRRDHRPQLRQRAPCFFFEPRRKMANLLRHETVSPRTATAERLEAMIRSCPHLNDVRESLAIGHLYPPEAAPNCASTWPLAPSVPTTSLSPRSSNQTAQSRCAIRTPRPRQHRLLASPTPSSPRSP